MTWLQVVVLAVVFGTVSGFVEAMTSDWIERRRSSREWARHMTAIGKGREKDRCS